MLILMSWSSLSWKGHVCVLYVCACVRLKYFTYFFTSFVSDSFIISLYSLRFEVLAAASMKMTVLWVVARWDLLMEAASTSETSASFYQTQHPRRQSDIFTFFSSLSLFHSFICFNELSSITEANSRRWTSVWWFPIQVWEFLSPLLLNFVLECVIMKMKKNSSY
jgi:hypothetical protein